MRAIFLTVALGVAAAALFPSHQANAWWDRWHRWHPGFYGPRVMVAPPIYAPRPYYRRPYARWIPPHYNPWGRLIPGHWA